MQAMKGMKTLRSGRNRRKWIYVLLLMGLLGLSGCGSPSSASTETSSEAPSEVTQAAEATQEEQTELVKTGSMELQYAENFAVDYYEDGYKMLTTLPDSKRYLIVPEGQPVPRGLDEDVSILQEPLQNIYLVASGVMDMFASVDAVDQIRFSGQKQENWYIQTAKDAMAAGDMIYAGKYSKPDYELLVSEGCDLAIENRMITHSPEVVEMLQGFDIPVMIEDSYYPKRMEFLLKENLLGSTYEFFHNHGLIPTHSVKTVEICYATPEEAQRLGVPEKHALLLQKDEVFDQDDEVLHYSKLLTNPQRYRLTIVT